MKKYMFFPNFFILIAFVSCGNGVPSEGCKQPYTLDAYQEIKANSPSLVFVHIGDILPPYMVEATHQARLFNPELTIYAIVDQTVILQANDPRYKEDNIIFVPIQQLEQSSQHQQFLELSQLDTDFRKGFWRNASERFFLIDELVKQWNLNDVFHMEYDTMLYANLESMMSAFHLYPAIAAVFVNDLFCIPCFIYFSNSHATNQLTNFMAENVSRGWNDMETLAKYKIFFGDEAISNLPSIMPAYVKDKPLKRINDQAPKSVDSYTNNFSSFSSIFDPNAIGQYLGGIDPRNGYSAPFLHINPNSLYDPSLLTIKWEVDHQDKKVPFAQYGDTKCRINNLHIHSKNLAAFRS